MSEVADVLTALGGLALILGVAIGLLELRGLGRQREEELVIRLYAPFLDPAFSAGGGEMRALYTRCAVVAPHPVFIEP